MDSGIKVSKPNKSAESTDPRDFTIHSDYNTLKIAKEEQGTMAATAGFQTLTKDITHNLGYNPLYLLYIEDPKTNIWGITPVAWSESVSAVVKVQNDNTLRIIMNTGDFPSYPVNIKYKIYIMIEPRKDAWYE